MTMFTQKHHKAVAKAIAWEREVNATLEPDDPKSLYRRNRNRHDGILLVQTALAHLFRDDNRRFDEPQFHRDCQRELEKESI